MHWFVGEGMEEIGLFVYSACFSFRIIFVSAFKDFIEAENKIKSLIQDYRAYDKSTNENNE